MRRTTSLKTFLLAAIVGCCLGAPCLADVVLTFDQNNISDSVVVDQAYGDRVTAPLDGNGHAYDVVLGNGLGLTPNVEVSYTGDSPELWTSGYGDLNNVLYDEIDGATGFEITFDADPGFEVGIFGFDMAAFGGGETLPGMEIIDGNNNLLWSAGSTFINGTTRVSFDTGGVFGESLTIAVDLTGLSSGSDNIGIDNIHFGQRLTAVPEPAGASVFLVGLLGILGFRRRGIA